MIAPADTPGVPGSPATTPGNATDTHELDTALLTCQRELRSIGRDGYNQHADYGYTSADQWIAQSRDVLHRHELMARRERWTITPWGERAIIAATFTVTHVPTGQRLTMDTSLAVQDRKGTPIDKAILAGLTSLWAYTLRDLLLVPRCDGNELDALDDQPHDPFGRDTMLGAMKTRGIEDSRAVGIAAWFAGQCKGEPTPGDLEAFKADIAKGVFDAWAPPVPPVTTAA